METTLVKCLSCKEDLPPSQFGKCKEKRNGLKSICLICLRDYDKIRNSDPSICLKKLWNNMIHRCYSAKNDYYSRYGGRGIRVADEWREDYFNFASWCLLNGYDPSLQLDRENNDGDYTPSNCRFVTRLENVRNSTITKLDASLVKQIRASTGVSQHDLANQYGVSPSAISSILHNRAWVDPEYSPPKKRVRLTEDQTGYVARNPAGLSRRRLAAMFDVQVSCIGKIQRKFDKTHKRRKMSNSCQKH